MTESEAIALCKYYKGEPDNPYSEHQDSKGLFWFIESIFVGHIQSCPDFLDKWEAEVEDYIVNHPNLKNDITDSKKYSMKQKALIFYIDAMIGKWRPGDEGMIFDY